MMFCQNCGQSLQENAQFCSKCGAPTSKSEKRSDSSPTVDISINEQNAIWNPNAASNWSLIFTPAFGSYLHALNWRTLGEQDRASSAMVWFYFSLVMLVVYIFMGMFIADEKAANGAARGLAFLYLIIWYFSAGRSQAKYVKAKFGKDHPRRGWGKPLLIGVAAIIGYFILAVAVGATLGMMMI
ncbi:MAG: zinc-ribbon domain-containing protein [Candidatus Babeliaceae bacterium]|nr:zinc-ribbon domain-containing protein [Candidatus Babeliaceae bacterium]